MVARVAERAVQPAGVPAALSDLVQALSNLVETTRPEVRGRAVHLFALASLVIAGAAVRLWGLGDVGLHGDEETMAMAVRGILMEGIPTLPSGMFYPRGMTQLYAMALSVSVFGESEWALRLPSVLCGAALIALAYIVGRRFLRPHWNLAFTATVAFLPALILYSQTARMYIFLVTSVMASLACLFEWERTSRGGWLFGAVLALIIGLDMHLLAIAAAPMFFLPGLARHDVRKLLHGAAAVLVVGFAYVAVELWTNSNYPVPPPEFAAGLMEQPRGGGRSIAFVPNFTVAVLSAAALIAFLAVAVARAIPVRIAAVASAALLLAGLGLQLILFYHLAAVAYLVGIVVARRYGSPGAVPRILIFILGGAVLGLVHLLQLESASSSIKLIGALVGQPSVWPYVRVAQLSEAAGLLTAASLAWGFYQIAHRRRVDDYWLLAVLGVWMPVLALGFFAWNVPSRYTSMSLAPLLLCAFAFAQRISDQLAARFASSQQGAAAALAAALLALCAIDPAKAAAIVTGGYNIHPDHKGAAEFMASQRVTPEDLVLAEDVLQQTYYLGSVDYWLIGRGVARHYVTREGDAFVDFYTGTPVVSSAAMLDALLEQHAGRRVFVIGSGENQRDGRRYVRGAELHAVIESSRFETVFTGRDGLTRVLRAVPRQAPAKE